jgi:hypothetical protein
MTFKKDFGITELSEIAHINRMKFLMKNWDTYKHEFPVNKENDFEYNPKSICKKYVAGYNKVIRIKYHKSSKYTTKIGRWFAHAGVGIQSLPRKIRHTICKGLYIDLDFKNCHPVILKTLCIKHKIECPYLTDYIENRDTLLTKWSNDLDIPKEDCKHNFLAMLNGNKTKYDTDNWTDMILEFENIHLSISALPEYKYIYDEVCKSNFDNLFGKTTNRVLCEIENKCLIELFKILKGKNMLFVDIEGTIYTICALIFDGLQIPDNPVNREKTTPEWLKKYSAIIEAITGFYLDIAIKPFDEALVLPDNFEDDINDEEEIIITNDGDAYNAVMSKYGHLMISCNDDKYLKIGNTWTNNPKIIHTTLYKWIYDLPMKKELKQSVLYYNRDKPSINKCLEMVENLGFKIDNDFEKKNQELSKKYLPFEDGVYSFVDKKLLKYDEVSVQFTNYIKRKFPIHNKDALDKLMKHIIIPIYPNEEERKYIMFLFARIMAGHIEDKKWYICKGSRNSGKGIITTLLQNAFTIFVETFNANTFISKKVETADEDKNLMWACCARNARMNISNEVDEKVVLNGALIKKFASGGDRITGRVNHGMPFKFIPQFSLLFMCNEIKDPDPIDALENCVQVYYKSKFVEKDKLIDDVPFLKLKDDNVKDMVIDEFIIDAFTLYLLEHYAPTMDMPQSIKDSCAVLNENRPLTLEQFILKNYRYSINANDKIFNRDILVQLSGAGFSLPPNSRDITSIIIKCGIGKRSVKGTVSINGEVKAGYSNIIYIGKEPDENCDDNYDDE